MSRQTKRTRYIVKRDAFNNGYTFDTKKVRIRTPRVKYTMSWDAFVSRPEKQEKAKGGQR
ncbi:hypothetical protein GGD56_003894 [Rhizobium mongolense]|uniref:Uncharacterized protein n=2 Tax=Rhizobium mongolense TaxID=57676 RepID=A0ABR6IR13_9HYPH|nr:hypothetical protein [Rhizobium mongolense]TVZ72825.1 hypothetical protein BCL32_1012 [Rhizobium mongolense USDA 1844]